MSSIKIIFFYSRIASFYIIIIYIYMLYIIYIKGKKKKIEMKRWYNYLLNCEKIKNIKTTSTHMGLPPEFKHINEGRKRN